MRSVQGVSRACGLYGDAHARVLPAVGVEHISLGAASVSAGSNCTGTDSSSAWRIPGSSPLLAQGQWLRRHGGGGQHKPDCPISLP